MRSKNTDIMNQIKEFAENYYLEFSKSPSTSQIANAEYGGEVEHLGRCELNTFVAVN